MDGPIFRDYEAAVLKSRKSRLVRHLSDQVVEDIIENSEFVSYRSTEVGYFLTVRHPSLNNETFTSQILAGFSGSLEFDFIAFLGQGELTFECICGSVPVPKNIRDLEIEIFG